MGLFKNKDYAEIHIKFDERKQDEEKAKDIEKLLNKIMED